MFAGTLALLQRSLRADAQKGRAHAFRIASVIIILVMLLVAQFSSTNEAAPGLAFFWHISALGMVLIILAGLGHFVTAITEEKEEGTLGLLLLADLSPISILLGKSTSRVLSAWQVFVAQFPFALLALTLGGITVRQIAATYITLAMFLFMVANLALLASVCSRRTTQAVGAMLLLLFLILGFIPWIRLQLQYLSGPGLPLDGSWKAVGDDMFSVYKAFSVYHRVQETLTARYQGGLWGPQATFSLFIGGLAFFLSWVVFRRLIWEADSTSPPRMQAFGKQARWWNSVPRVWRWAIVWKDFHFLLGGYSYWIAKVLLAAGLWWMYFWWRDWVHALTFLDPFAALQNTFLLLAGLELLYACSQLYHVEQKEGTLSNLLMLPHSTGVISYSKLTGCLLGIAPNLLLALGLALIRNELGEIREGFLDSRLVFAWGLFFILCHLSVLCSLYVKWGGTALAIAMLAVICTIVMPVAGAMMHLIEEGEHTRFAQVAPLYYVIGGVCGALQVAIMFRLEELSGN